MDALLTLYELRSASCENDGVRVAIFDTMITYVTPTEGFDVPPRRSASFALRPRRIKRLGRPYGICSDVTHVIHQNWSELRLYTNLLECQKMCQQRNVIRHCYCWDVDLPNPRLMKLYHGRRSTSHSAWQSVVTLFNTSRPTNRIAPSSETDRRWTTPN